MKTKPNRTGSRPDKEKRFLLTGYYFDGWSGSMMHICEISQYLIGAGWDVTVCCGTLSDGIKAHVEGLGAHIYQAHLFPENLHFDAALCYHFPILPVILSKNTVIDKLIFGCLSSIVPLELPSVFLCAPACKNKIHVHSRKLAEYLSENYGISAQRIFVMPNPAPDAFFTQPQRPLPDRPGRIAVVSNHVPAEVRQAAQLLRDSGITADIFGREDTFVNITPQLLNGYDLVVTIGKTIQYALALGIPAYCYDHFGGPGYITPENIDKEEYTTFSGRSSARRLTAEDLRGDILGGWAAARSDTAALKQQAEQRYRLSALMPEYILNEQNMLTFDAAAILSDTAAHLYRDQMAWAEPDLRLSLERARELERKKHHDFFAHFYRSFFLTGSVKERLYYLLLALLPPLRKKAFRSDLFEDE